MPRKQILVIDDNPINLRIAALTLELGDFVVRTARDAGSALEMLETWAPDAIAVDIHMPGMGGLSFIRALRQRPAKLPIPVIAMSAYDPPPRLQLERLGFCGFIGKPMAPRDFCQQLNCLIEPPTASAEPVPGVAPAPIL